MTTDHSRSTVQLEASQFDHKSRSWSANSGRPLGVPKESMSQAARMLTLLSKAIVSLSTKLSAAAVLGFAALSLLPHDATSRIAAATQQPAAAPVEVIPANPVPPTEGAPADPAFQLAARRSKPKPEPA